MLYPDPEKDPTRDSLVRTLWDEFDTALDGATHVLVIGHSLHDPALVGRLADLPAFSRLAVGLFGYPGPAKNQLIVDELTKERIQALLPTLPALTPIRFGPRPIAHLSKLESWIDRRYLFDDFKSETL